MWMRRVQTQKQLISYDSIHRSFKGRQNYSMVPEISIVVTWARGGKEMERKKRDFSEMLEKVCIFSCSRIN